MRRFYALAAALAVCLLVARMPAWSAELQFPALDRPAVKVRTPERSVLLAAALAGKRLVAIGEHGVVALSDDDGATWRQARTVPVGVTLTALQFIDGKVGWAVGHGGVILKTRDGGDTWMRQADGRSLAKSSLAEAQAHAAGARDDVAAAAQLKLAQQLVDDGPDKPLFDLHFDSASHGYVVGAYNLFFETTDGGATWKSRMGRLDNPKASHLYAIGVSGQHIFIAGEQGTLFRSEDDGASFRPLASPYKGSWFSVVVLGDKSLVVAGLRGNALYSADHGNSWSAIVGAPPVTFVGGIALPDGTALLSNQAGQLLSTHAGEPFKPLPVPSLPPLAGLLSVPSGGLLAVGFNGAMRIPPSDAAVRGTRVSTAGASKADR